MPEVAEPTRRLAPERLDVASASTLSFDPASLDRMLHAWQSQFTAGWSPSIVGLAFADWAAHAANSPFQTAALGRSALDQWVRLAQGTQGSANGLEPNAYDHRFSDPAWKQPPFDVLVQSVLLGEQWWNGVVQSPSGVNVGNRHIVAFMVQQWLDLMSPSNVPWLNPEIIAKTRTDQGQNLVRGMQNFLDDQSASSGAKASKDFTVGLDLACTPGKVVFRNPLIELIQYAPSTPTVRAEPVLIVPAWIMKYYILDLSEHNSLIRWLVGQGHTVFAISWRNPGIELRDTSLDDYRLLGVMAALDSVEAICGPVKVHATGYCLGGTLLSIAAAAMARDGDDRLESLSLLAAQTDFTEAGELRLFISEDQLDFLGDVMKARGFLESGQMASAFQMLQSNDLLWSPAIRHYMLGEREAPFDLMVWNKDGTRLPARMHIEYLRQMYLDNDLAQGRYTVSGRPVELGDMKLPFFIVATENDQVAPWHSVFKFHQQNDGDVTFVLTSGGHNAGIVSEPGHPNRHYRIKVREHGDRTLGPVEWEQETPPHAGSWWVEWNAWLTKRSAGQITPPAMGTALHPALCDAPGTYVLEP